jgi:hypothetical protein
MPFVRLGLERAFDLIAPGLVKQLWSWRTSPVVRLGTGPSHQPRCTLLRRHWAWYAAHLSEVRNHVRHEVDDSRSERCIGDPPPKAYCTVSAEKRSRAAVTNGSDGSTATMGAGPIAYNCSGCPHPDPQPTSSARLAAADTGEVGRRAREGMRNIYP